MSISPAPENQERGTLSIEHCEILEVAGIWIYRATVLVDGRRSIGDAELALSADPDAPDGRHPISSAQRVAVENALHLLTLLSQQTQQGAGPPHPAVAAPVEERMSASQIQQLTALCQRLGKPLPRVDCLSAVAADQLIADVQAEEADLLRAADEARATLATPLPGSVVDPALVRQLKQQWRSRFQPAGDTAAQQALWHAFANRVCGQEVSDTQMRPAQYERLLHACGDTPPAPASAPSASSHPEPAPVRQAPRLAAPAAHRQKERTS